MGNSAWIQRPCPECPLAGDPIQASRLFSSSFHLTAGFFRPASVYYLLVTYAVTTLNYLLPPCTAFSSSVPSYRSRSKVPWSFILLLADRFYIPRFVNASLSSRGVMPLLPSTVYTRPP
ncbi:hypothetical protein BO71DRAFT_47787 [Aspergillus ellipticus CBS 707.79]|uniref:Uncharacterized protein n=1 Tax=Aspergillus ellipticus CBS 707.79 TaxID=1448320 RepID=A0A319DTQ4_9EURO|nr:hypothetical protein BO71DRAFT_47787 [Aspergillus ellipticus CBS 707.79]